MPHLVELNQANPPLNKDISLDQAKAIAKQIESRAFGCRGWAGIVNTRLHAEKPMDAAAFDVLMRCASALSEEATDMVMLSDRLFAAIGARRVR